MFLCSERFVALSTHHGRSDLLQFPSGPWYGILVIQKGNGTEVFSLQKALLSLEHTQADGMTITNHPVSMHTVYGSCKHNIAIVLYNKESK